MEYSKITKKGQVTIPLKFRELLKIQTGEKVVFDLERDNVVIKKAPLNPVANMVGLGKGIFGNSLKYQRKIRDEWEAK